VLLPVAVRAVKRRTANADAAADVGRHPDSAARAVRNICANPHDRAHENAQADSDPAPDRHCPTNQHKHT